jgi:hypothetical protein
MKEERLRRKARAASYVSQAKKGAISSVLPIQAPGLRCGGNYEQPLTQ